MTFDLVNYGFDPFYDFFAPVSRRENHAISMKTDVKEDETHYMMDVELPGVKKEDINEANMSAMREPMVLLLGLTMLA